MMQLILIPSQGILRNYPNSRKSVTSVRSSARDVNEFPIEGLVSRPVVSLNFKVTLDHRRSTFGPTFLFYHFFFLFIFTCSVSTANLPCH